MKQHLRFILSGICLLALLAVGALAQTQEQEEAKKKADLAQADKIKKAVGEEMEFNFRGEVFKVLGSKFGFETKFVKGAPYSATAEFETVQTLADGNHIRSKSATIAYRDSEGRTRRENVGRESGVVTEIFISDPTTGVNYHLDPQRRVALNSGMTNLKELEVINKKLTAEAELKQKVREGGQVLQGEGMPIKKSKQSVMTSLGKQMIEGLECEGTRITVTIPAGQIGNDLPIEIVSEEWYSPALQILVLTRQNDPRSGETTYRLTNLNRSEPDRTLFEVPADYKVEKVLPMKKRKPEEEQ